MSPAYLDSQSVREYLNFLASADGQIFRDVIFNSVKQRLPQSPRLTILDAGSGSGWLTNQLSQNYPNTQGCDASPELIQHAQTKYPKLKFACLDLTQNLPYGKEQFDAIIFSMVSHDLDSQLAALKNLCSILKPGGKLVATIVNPYYGFPVGAWKRGWLGWLLRKQPKLKLINSYNQLAQKAPTFQWRPNLSSHFYPLSQTTNNFLSAGFTLSYFEDLNSKEDSPQFNLTYQLHRFPIILLLEFKKN